MNYASANKNFEPEKLCRQVLQEFKPYVPGKSIEDIKNYYQLDEVIKLASNENPHGTSKYAVEAISNPSNLHLYPQRAYANLQDKLAQSLNLNANQIIIGNGSDELIKLITTAFLNRDEESLMADITFSIYKMAVTEMEGRITKIPLENYKHNVDEFIKNQCDTSKLIFICNPNNPTGTIITHEEAEYLMQNVSSDTIVVFDEAYREYVTDNRFPNTEELVNKYPNLIALRTFSKIYGLAALRVGYGIAHESIVSLLSKIKLPFNVNQLGLTAAKAALDDHEHLQFSYEENVRNKDILMKELDNYPGLHPLQSQGNFILVKTDIDDEHLAQQLLSHGVIVRSGTSLGIPNHFRLTIGSQSENEFFLQKLAKCEVNSQ